MGQPKRHNTARDSGPKRHRDPKPWEVQILVLLSEHVAIPMDLLACMLKVPRERAVRMMEQFASYRWVEIKQFIVADEPWVWLRQAGSEHANTGFYRATPTITSLPHRRAVCAIRLELEEQYPDGIWISERALTHRKGFAHHIPDAAFEVRNEEGKIERWAIEAELSAKKASRYRQIARERHERYDRLLYFCSPHVAKLLRRIPEFETPMISIRRFFKDPRGIENFQWAWSSTSGPGEAGVYRHPQPWEVEIIRLIAEQTAMSVDHLGRFMECDDEAAQRIADYLDEAGFLSQGRGPTDEPPWLWVTKTGGRLAGTGLFARPPTPASTERLRLANEARLHVAERDWDVQWWSMRLLRRGAERRNVPTAIVESGAEQNAVEIEVKKGTEHLIEKYGRRCNEFDAVAAFCSPGRVATFERLKREQGWTNLYVQSFSPLQRRERRQQRRRRPVRYVPTSLEELPAEALEAVQEAERLLSPPRVRAVSVAAGAGFSRWRVTTDSREWRVARTPFGWFVRPCDELDEPLASPDEDPPEAKKPKRQPKPRARILPRSLKKIPLSELPDEAVEAIRVAAEAQSAPRLIAAKRRRGPGFPRWRVETDTGIWRVTWSPQHGWLAKPARGAEEANASSMKRWPRDPPGAMVDVEPWELPYKVVRTIEEAAGLAWPPKVIAASKRVGKGSARWRVVTDHDTWRVTSSSHGWNATLSE